MKRKHNPWVSLAALLLLVTLLVTVCTGCGATQAEAEEPARFIIEVESIDSFHHVTILTDTETGAQYLFYKAANAGGLVMLQPAPAKEG